jgi:transposase
MAMGKKQARQQDLWIAATELPKSGGHFFYNRVNGILEKAGFDAFAETECFRFYKSEVMGRPSMAPGVYFRMLLIGYFEGIDSERGIAWRCADSMSLKSFLGYGLTDATPDHTTVSRTRRLIDLETHGRVFTWILSVLTGKGLIDGKTIGVDATTLEANAAMRSIVRRDSGESYSEYLKGLAKASGIETPTQEDLARMDRKRSKTTSNEDWEHPDDPDAKVAKMKDGSTHLAHKVEHAVDMETGAVLALTLQGAHIGDTTTIQATLIAAAEQIEQLTANPETAQELRDNMLAEVVTDKGYHSNAIVTDLKQLGIRSYVSEPKRGRRNWIGKPEQRNAVYANRRRIQGERGKTLMRRRGLMLERPFAHCYETGGMRRVHLRGHDNILKRLLIHVGGYNLSLVLRLAIGKGTPRGLQDLATLSLVAYVLLTRLYKDQKNISMLFPALETVTSTDNRAQAKRKLNHTIGTTAPGC